MFDFFSDHAAVMAQLEAFWDAINVNNILAYFMNGLFALAIFGMFSKVRMRRIDG